MMPGSPRKRIKNLAAVRDAADTLGQELTKLMPSTEWLKQRPNDQLSKCWVAAFRSVFETYSTIDDLFDELHKQLKSRLEAKVSADEITETAAQQAPEPT